MNNNIAFIILSPDAISTGIYKKAIKLISEFNIDFFCCKWVKITKKQLQKIYLKNYKIPSFNCHLVEILFSLDYSLVCQVRSNSHSDLIQFLKKYKGPSNSLNCKDENLRKLLGAENRILNFIHTSDTTKDAIKESGIFFQSLKTSKFGIPPEPNGICKIPSVSIWHTKTKLRHSIFQRMGINDEKMVNTFEDLYTVSKKEEKSLADINKIAKIEKKQNAHILKKVKDSYLISVLKEIGNLHAVVHSELINKLRILNFNLSNWDELIINCHKEFLNDPKK